LSRLGVRDSKKLSPSRREELAAEIEKMCDWQASIVWPEEIDRYVNKELLNELELKAFAEIIAEFDCRDIVVDAADPDEERFGRRLSELSGRSILSRHKADELFPSVSAASIMAKTIRDRLVAEISYRMGTVTGSGYPSDNVTVKYLEAALRSCKIPPPFIRRSWEPVQRMQSASKVKKLEYFSEHND